MSDFKKAMKAAMKGEATAQFVVGAHIKKRAKTYEDYQKSLEWILKAADQG